MAMKAKMRPHNIPEKAFVDAQKLAREIATRELERMHEAVDKRCILSMALALRDICGYGQERIDRVLQGVEELVRGYMDEYLADTDKGIEAIEKTNTAMIEELANSGRGISLEKYFK